MTILLVTMLAAPAVIVLACMFVACFREMFR